MLLRHILNIEIAKFTKGSFKFIPQEAIRTVITKTGNALSKKMYKFNMLLARQPIIKRWQYFIKAKLLLQAQRKK